jgi:hypothetical protein
VPFTGEDGGKSLNLPASRIAYPPDASEASEKNEVVCKHGQRPRLLILDQINEPALYDKWEGYRFLQISADGSEAFIAIQMPPM